MTRPETAEAAYHAKQDQILVALKRMEADIRLRDFGVRDGRINWGHVGDAGHVLSQLAEMIVGFHHTPAGDATYDAETGEVTVAR